MQYARKATDIVAYTFQAENLCPGCMIAKTVKAKTTRDYILENQDLEVEKWLDFLAKTMRVDRMDEHSFDSGDFPKVVFDSQLLDGEKCDSCGGEL